MCLLMTVPQCRAGYRRHTDDSRCRSGRIFLRWATRISKTSTVPTHSLVARPHGRSRCPIGSYRLPRSIDDQSGRNGAMPTQRLRCRSPSASMITFFTSVAMPFRTCGLEIKFDGATFTRAHFGSVEWCHAIENACNVMMELINETVYCVCRIHDK